MLMFGTITYFLIDRAPFIFIFPLAFGFFSLLLFFITARLWLGTTRVVIGGSGSILTTSQLGLLGVGPTRQIALSDIDSISSRITANREEPLVLPITTSNSSCAMERDEREDVASATGTRSIGWRARCSD